MCYTMSNVSSQIIIHVKKQEKKTLNQDPNVTDLSELAHKDFKHPLSRQWLGNVKKEMELSFENRIEEQKF